MKSKGLDTAKSLSENIKTFDNYYLKPDWWFRFRYDTQIKRKTCLFLLRRAHQVLRNQRVLEIGFGSGALLFSFHPSCEIFGVEISNSAVRRAEQKARERGFKAAKFQVIKSEQLPYPDGHFDIIIASHVVEHVQDDSRLLAEIRRTLKDDGVSVILIPINEAYNDPNHLHRYTGEAFRQLVRQHFFNIQYHMENELLFHIVEKFYFEEYNYRWKVMGPLIAAMFNFPTSMLPFWAHRLIDKTMLLLGWKPRQFGCILAKSLDNHNLSV